MASGRQQRITAGAIALRKGGGTAFPMITAYDAPFARLAEDAGIDLLLVGDSLGMVVLGFDSTVPVELSDMVRHGAAVARATARAHIVVDLPFMTYAASDEAAIRAAAILVQRGGATSVKLEGGRDLAARVAAIVKSGIPVMAHIGVLPQTAGLSAGFGRRRAREQLLADAEAVQDAGAYAVVLEMVASAVTAEITQRLSIPTIGIGSGPHCDGQVLVLHDVLGLYDASPPFARRYVDLSATVREALSAYANDVRSGAFPAAPQTSRA